MLLAVELPIVASQAGEREVGPSCRKGAVETGTHIGRKDAGEGQSEFPWMGISADGRS